MYMYLKQLVIWPLSLSLRLSLSRSLSGSLALSLSVLLCFIIRTTMDCFEAPRMDLNLIFIKVSAAPTGALGPWKVEEP